MTIYRQTGYRAGRGGVFSLLAIGACLIFSARIGAGEPSTSDLDPVLEAEDAVTHLSQGDSVLAAREAYHARQLRPNDPAVEATLGAVLLTTGDARGAYAALHLAIEANPEDSLTQYGAGVAQLALGHRAAAMDCFGRSERLGGDKSILLVARRYTQWLDGAQLSLGGAGVTGDMMASVDALVGMSKARLADWGHVIDPLSAAQRLVPGDQILQPVGLLMTFDPVRPVGASGAMLPEGVEGELGDSPPGQSGKVLSGEVQLAPNETPADMAYASYEMDGQPLCLINIRPFHFVLDTRRVANGRHNLSVVLYDASIREISRSSRSVHVFNRDVVVAAVPPQERVERIQAELWKAFALKPDRRACAYSLGLATRATGKTLEARGWFARALAIEPEYRDARRQWLTCGGAAEAGPTVYGGVPSEKVVALTFDDGPKPGVTEPLLDILTHENVPATFFVIGRHVMEYPDLTRKIAAAGMEIANHSYTHRNLTRLTDDAIAQEVMETQAAVETVTGKSPRFLRPPGGNWNTRVAKVTRQWGLTPCFWTVDVYAAEVIGAQEVADAVLKQVQPGSIVLMHNGKVSTLQALPTIIKELRARGYSFETVDSLAKHLAAARITAAAAVIHRVE